MSSRRILPPPPPPPVPPPPTNGGSSGPIQLLGASDLLFTPAATDFTGLAAKDLATLSNVEDLIDAALIDFAASIAGQTKLSGLMDGDLTEMQSVSDEISADDFDAILGIIAGIAAAGDTKLNDFLNLIGA